MRRLEKIPMSRNYIRPESPFYIVMLGLLSALPPLATDMGLPAIPALEAAFNVSIGEATRTLTVFVLGFLTTIFDNTPPIAKPPQNAAPYKYASCIQDGWSLGMLCHTAQPLAASIRIATLSEPQQKTSSLISSVLCGSPAISMSISAF
jgi:hypothetical protein